MNKKTDKILSDINAGYDNLTASVEVKAPIDPKVIAQEVSKVMRDEWNAPLRTSSCYGRHGS